jgi:hypothetical protein
MSDDTPTRKFETPNDDAPTERFDEVSGTGGLGATGDGAGGDGGGDTPIAATDRERSKRLIIVLSVIGGILLIAIIVLLVSLLARGGEPLPAPTDSPTPTASSTPTATPTPSASPTPTPTATSSPTSTPTPPPPPSEGISSFDVDKDRVDCGGQSSVPVQFDWAANGVQLWFGVGTTNAKDAPQDSFPLVYSLDFDYSCGQPSGSQIYTITVQESNGTIESETIEIRED